MNDLTQSEDEALKADLHIQAAYRLTEALVASEKKMRRRIELLSEVVFETDASGAFAFLNDAWHEILGYELRSSLGTKLQDYLHPDDRQAFLGYEARGPGDPDRSVIELRFIAKLDSMISMELSASPLEGGGMVGTLYNVTQRNLEQAELGMLSLVASFTDSLVIITNAEGQIEWVNQAFIHKTGYTLHESQGKRPGLLLQGPDTDASTIEMITNGMLASKSFQCEVLNYTKVGQEYWVASFFTPIFDAKGKLERFIAVQNDITMMRQMQQDLQSAKEAAERASQAKSVFLAAMSHEIRTPLNGVLGMVSQLLESNMDDGQKQRARIIKDSSEALVTIVNDILDYSKIESGRFSLSSEEFSARTVMEDSVSLFKGNAETKKLELKGTFIGDDSIAVLGDRGRLRQVLMNLISNAIKFTSKGEVSVQMAQRTLGDEIEIEVEVTDTGIGIADEDLTRLFVHFSQIDGSSTRRQGGTGLGLAISKQLVEMMDGTIGVRTTLGTGSTFWFQIKLPRSTASATTVETQTNHGTIDFRGMRALIAEDNMVNQMVLKGILDTLGLDVDIVENGVEAVEGVRRGDYSFILMDVHMPEMDGLEATRIIRSMSRIPIVAVTANVMPDQIKVCFESGMNGFVPKPISRQSIESELVRVLGSQMLPSIDAAISKFRSN